MYKDTADGNVYYLKYKIYDSQSAVEANQYSLFIVCRLMLMMGVTKGFCCEGPD